MKKKSVKRKSPRRNNVLNSIAVIVIMIIFVGIVSYQTKELKEKKSELGIKEQKLQEEYETESEKTSELEKQRVYVQTKEYIEEAARKLGFVYPDEIILKPKKD